MIRFIAAIDGKRGIADDHGIPWDLPSDKQYYRDKVRRGIILMGYGTYAERIKPIHNRTNYVATKSSEKLRNGFVAVGDARQFLDAAESDVWVIGGAGLFETTLDLADELYLTQVEGDFGCTKFFPPYNDKFELVWLDAKKQENQTNFQYQIWHKLLQQQR